MHKLINGTYKCCSFKRENGPLVVNATIDELNLFLEEEFDSVRNRCVLYHMIDSICLSLKWEKSSSPIDEDDLFFIEMFNHLRNRDILLRIRFEKSLFFNYDVEKLKIVQNGLLQAIQEVHRDIITKEIQDSKCLAIVVKNMNGINEVPCFAVILRFIRRGKMSHRLWSFLDPRKHDLANGILLMLESIRVYETPLKLIAQAYDGSPQLAGSVQEHIKAVYPNAHYVHSYGFNLDSVMIKVLSLNKEIGTFFLKVMDISDFFSICYIAETLRRIRGNNPIQFPTDDMSLSKSIQIIFKNLLNIKKFLNAIKRNESIQNRNIPSQASRLISIIQSCSFDFWLSFFQDVMAVMDVLSEDMEVKLRCQNLPAAKESLRRFEESILRISNRLSEDVGKRESQLDDTHTKWKVMYIKYIKKQAIVACGQLIAESKLRFSCERHFIAEQLFNTDKYEEYLIRFPDDILIRVCYFYGILEVHRLRRELETLYRLHKFNTIKDLYVYLATGGPRLPETMKLLEILFLVSPNILLCSPIRRVENEPIMDNERVVGEQVNLAVLKIAINRISEEPQFQNDVIETLANVPKWRYLFSNKAITKYGVTIEYK